MTYSSCGQECEPVEQRHLEIFSNAEAVFGSKQDAERWMTEPAMGLDGARPIDLLCTPWGAHLVNQFLERLKYGVYN